MKALIQRVSRGSVTVGPRRIGAVGRGYVVLLGVCEGDTEMEAEYLARRTLSLRVFPDETGKMNRSVRDIGGGLLVISQFTLCADTRKGNRPGFARAAPPETAERLYERYVAALRDDLGDERVATGSFGADMTVEILNDGPVTILLDTDRRKAGAPCPNPRPDRKGRASPSRAHGETPFDFLSGDRLC